MRFLPALAFAFALLPVLAEPRYLSPAEMATPPPASPVGNVPTGCPAFEIAAPRPASSAVVRAVDFGFSETNRCNGAAIRRAVVEAKRLGAAKVVLAPGRYLCHDAEGILLDGLADFTFDGMGAELVFYRPAAYSPSWVDEEDPAHPRSSFLLKDCTRVRFGNLKVDWDWSLDPLATFFRIVDVHVDSRENASYVDLELPDGARHPLYGKTLPMLTMTPMKETMDGFEDDVYGGFFASYEGNTGSKSEWLAPNRLRFWPRVLPTAPDAVVGEHARTRYYSAKQNLAHVKRWTRLRGRIVRFAHHYYGKGAFKMDSCAHLTMHDIRLYSTFGMGFVVKGRQHHWQLVDCVIAPPPGVKRPITVTADSLHVVNSLGWAKLLRYSTCLNQDDLFNFHDRVSAARRAGPRRLAFTHRRANPYFGARPGMSLELRQLNYEPTGLHVKVVRATDTELEIDRDVPEARFGSYILALDEFSTDHVLLRDCTFDGALGRGIFTVSDVTVENCRFRDHMRCAFKFTVGLMMKEWAEGSSSTNVVVRGCTFENVQRTRVDGFGGKNPCESFVGRNLNVSYEDGTFDLPEWQGAVGGILYENNTWINPRVPILHAYCAKDVLVRNNTIVLGEPLDARYDPHRGEILCERSDGVRAYGNRFRTAAP